MARTIIATAVFVLMAGLAFAQSAPQQLRAIQDCPTCPEMVVIPQGSFNMGTGPSDFELDRTGPGRAEAGLAKIAINKSFAIGRTEITRIQYATFVLASGYNPEIKFCRTWDQQTQSFSDAAKHSWNELGLLTTPRDDHPVTCVSWDDAVAYTQWLSKQTSKRYRLPSEAEWEYAARGGSNKKRFWGDDASEGCAYANIYDLTARRVYPLSWAHGGCADGFSDLAPVAPLLPNNFGLHDVIGNVWEWVADCFTTSKVGRPKDQRAWVWQGCPDRAIRGGSWMLGPDKNRVAFPSGVQASDRYSSMGFRIARALDAGEN